MLNCFSPVTVTHTRILFLSVGQQQTTRHCTQWNSLKSRVASKKCCKQMLNYFFSQNLSWVCSGEEGPMGWKFLKVFFDPKHILKYIFTGFHHGLTILLLFFVGRNYPAHVAHRRGRWDWGYPWQKCLEGPSITVSTMVKFSNDWRRGSVKWKFWPETYFCTGFCHNLTISIWPHGRN